MNKKIILESTITCPECGHEQTETMAADTCQWFYECKACGVLLKPKGGVLCFLFLWHNTLPAHPARRWFMWFVVAITELFLEHSRSGSQSGDVK